jgi:uncharacterized integral membrane protein
MPTEEDSSAPGIIEHTEKMSTGAIVRLVIAGLVLIAILLFCVRNTDSTKIDYLFGDADAPLFVVVALSAVAGALLWSLASWRRHRRHRAER